MITSDFKKAFATLLLDRIKQIPLAEKVISSLFMWDDKDTEILNFALEKGFVTNEELLGAIDVLLKRNGRISYVQHLRDKVAAPDHTISPQAFAYALKHGEFSQKEINTIKFDHDDTKESFEKTYCHDIEQTVMKQLTTKRGPRKTYDDAECDCC